MNLRQLTLTAFLLIPATALAQDAPADKAAEQPKAEAEQAENSKPQGRQQRRWWNRATATTCAPT